MFYRLSDAEIRSTCKEKIESLEYWLRRLIDELLTKDYGVNYFDHQDDAGSSLINNKIKQSISRRRESEPTRFTRLIDATLLDEAVDIICKPNLFKKHFSEPLRKAFPDGREEARIFMHRLISPRNCLAHANPIGLRQAEQVLCYTNDIVDSIKAYYSEDNMSNRYNVPLIMKVTYSFGNTIHRSLDQDQIGESFHHDARFDLYPGDVLTVEIEVDPSFGEEEYTIRWSSIKGYAEPHPEGRKAVIHITKNQIGEPFDIQCRISSNRDWHRLNHGADDYMYLSYRVLPV